MGKLKIGAMVESFRCGIRGGIEKAAALGAEGVQMYATDGELAPEKQNGPAKLMLKMMLKAAKGDPNFRLTDDILPDRITWFANELCSEPESEHAPEIM